MKRCIQNSNKTLQQRGSSRKGLSIEAPGFIQPKLKMGSSGDRFEQEADRMADQAMGKIYSPTSERILKTNGDQVQQKNNAGISRIGNEMSGGFGVPGYVGNKLQRPSTGGSPLPKETRAEMEGVFGTDFGNVRIHDDAQAARMNQGLNAKAFTHGSDIYFNQGAYRPFSRSGKHLLAHELTHVVQQQGGETAVQGLYRWRRIPSGSKTMGPGITVRWSGNHMRITANMEIYGPEASEDIASQMEATIENYWNGSFDDNYQVTCNADINYRAEGTEASSSRTQIFVDDMAGPSVVTHYWIFGQDRSMNYNINSNINWTPAHEFGHLLGLPDHYSESAFSRISGHFGGERENTIDEGWEGNLMGAHGGVLEQKNLEEWFQLNAYELVTIVEDAIDSVAREIGRFEDSLMQGINPFVPH